MIPLAHPIVFVVRERERERSWSAAIRDLEH